MHKPPTVNHSERYSARGVSSTKDEVHQAIQNLDKGLYPGAFCKILPDIAAGDPAYCNILHADTAGTKASLAYIYWRETGDVTVWRGIAQDAIVMNIDDMACAGCVDDFLLSNTITRNKHLIPGEVLKEIIDGTVEFCNLMSAHGVHIHNAGGETADVGDIVRTVDVGFTAFGRMKRKNLVLIDIQEGDAIVGLASEGQACYENAYNSGIGSNGLTSARHDVLSHEYITRYPESFSRETPVELVYTGSKRLTDAVQIGPGTADVGKLLLSPTRTYTPMLSALYEELRAALHGVIHCTGGGQTKVSRFLRDGLCAFKNNLPEPPGVFTLIREESGASLKEMYQVFNMGIRLEVYLPADRAQEVVAVARQFDIDARVIGTVVRDADARVRIETKEGDLSY